MEPARGRGTVSLCPPTSGRSADPHKGWYKHQYIPHFDQPEIIQSITFRLADSLPSHVAQMLAEELGDDANEDKRVRMEEYLNSGYGACYLKDARIGRLVEETLLHFNDQRYRLIAWIVMPNHVHVLVEQLEGYPLGDVVRSWKTYTARLANKILGREGRFWFPGYFDRYIRDQRHLANAIDYIHNNPVKAGLADRPEEWPVSSARWFYGSGEEE